MKLDCAFCTELFEVGNPEDLKVGDEILRFGCSHCGKMNYLQDVALRCPFCAHEFVERLPQPAYYAGEIEVSCPAERRIFTLHMDNFVRFPKFELSYDDLQVVLDGIPDRELARLFYALRLRKLPSETGDGKNRKFRDNRDGSLLDERELHRRILRNRDICHAFYGLFMSLVR